MGDRDCGGSHRRALVPKNNPAFHGLGVQGNNFKGHATGHAVIFGTSLVDGQFHQVAGQPQFTRRAPGAVIDIGNLPNGNSLLGRQVVLVNFLIDVLVNKDKAFVRADFDAVGQASACARQQRGPCSFTPAPDITRFKPKHAAQGSHKIIRVKHTGVNHIAIAKAYNIVDEGIVSGKHTTLPL